MHARAMRQVGTIIRNASIPKHEADRVVLAKVLLAMLPESLQLVDQALSLTRGRPAAELQFSVFVFLGDAREMQDHRTSTDLLQIVSRFLHSVSRETGSAAWMAGDALGDHWPLQESLPVLFDAAINAKYRAGREGAMHGLSHALARGTKRQQWEIHAVLKQVSSGDRSASLRRYADSIVGDLRGI